MSDLPLKFIAHYESECGDSYEMWNFHAPVLTLYCDDCREKHEYQFIYLEHRIWEWEEVRDIWVEEGGLRDPYADND